MAVKNVNPPSIVQKYDPGPWEGPGRELELSSSEAAYRTPKPVSVDAAFRQWAWVTMFG